MNKITEFVFLNANIDHVNMFSFNQYFKEIEAGDLLYNGLEVWYLKPGKAYMILFPKNQTVLLIHDDAVYCL